jgi:hypothetical protein
MARQRNGEKRRRQSEKGEIGRGGRNWRTGCVSLKRGGLVSGVPSAVLLLYCCLPLGTHTFCLHSTCLPRDATTSVTGLTSPVSDICKLCGGTSAARRLMLLRLQISSPSEPRRNFGRKTA